MKKNNKIETNELTPEIKVSMKTRVITALILAAVCVPCVFLGNWFFFALSFVLTLLIAYELVNVVHMQSKLRFLIMIVTMVLMLSFVYWIVFKNNIRAAIDDFGNFDITKVLSNNFTSLNISTILLLVTAGIYFFITLVEEEFTVQRACYMIAMVVVVGLCIQSFLYLRYSPFDVFSRYPSAENPTFDINTPLFKYFQSTLLLVYVILGTIVNDIGAYFIGVLFGKHKLNPRISPKKTWEGFAGGCVCSFVATAAFAFIMDAVNLPILPNLSIEKWYWVILISLFLPLIANLGDFTFSAIKRSFNIKDFSHVLPGHGGVLDRFDSLLLVSGFVSVMLVFINSGWEAFKF